MTPASTEEVEQACSIAPERLQGLWSRRSLEEPVGVVTDNTSTVLWMQSKRFFADLRIPLRPQNRIGDMFLPSHHLWKQRGSAGTINIRRAASSSPDGGGWCVLWRSEVDLNPTSPNSPFLELPGTSDQGICALDETSAARDGELLIERGMNDEYLEEWIRVGNCAKQVEMTLEAFEGDSLGSSRKGFWLTCGEYFSYTVERKETSVVGTLAHAIAHESSSSLYSLCRIRGALSAEAVESFEQYFGRIDRCADGSSTWTVEHSQAELAEGELLHGEKERSISLEWTALGTGSDKEAAPDPILHVCETLRGKLSNVERRRWRVWEGADWVEKLFPDANAVIFV